MMVAAGGALLLGGALGGYVLIVFNGLVAMRSEVARAWGNIDVLLRQRQDEIPNLVRVCRAYAEHERRTLEAVVEARNHLGAARGVGQVAGADLALRQALHGLFAVVEGYPELRASDQFLALQRRISDLEDAIADRRELYNEAATRLNIRRQEFPDLVVARSFGFAPAEMWRDGPGRRPARRTGA